MCGPRCGRKQKICVILSGAAVQAERRISRGADPLHARFLGPLVKTRSFEMTHSTAVGLPVYGSDCGCQKRGVILSGAAVQAQRRISRGADPLHARFLGPLVKTRSFEMTHSTAVGLSVYGPSCGRKQKRYASS